MLNLFNDFSFSTYHFVVSCNGQHRKKNWPGEKLLAPLPSLCWAQLVEPGHCGPAVITTKSPKSSRRSGRLTCQFDISNRSMCIINLVRSKRCAVPRLAHGFPCGEDLQPWASLDPCWCASAWHSSFTSWSSYGKRTNFIIPYNL